MPLDWTTFAQIIAIIGALGLLFELNGNTERCEDDDDSL